MNREQSSSANTFAALLFFIAISLNLSTQANENSLTTQKAISLLSENAKNKVKNKTLTKLFENIDNCYITVFKDTSANQLGIKNKQHLIDTKRQMYAQNKQKVYNNVGSLRVKVIRDFDSLPIACVKATDNSAYIDLLNNDSVKSIHEIKPITHNSMQSLPLISQPAVISQGYQGAGTTVAVLDTGVIPSAPGFGCTDIGTPAGCRIVESIDIATDDLQEDASEVNHGTNVAGIVAAVAPETQLVVLDVFDPVSPNTLDVISGINWAITNQANYNIVAMNLSLGVSGERFNTECTDDWSSDAITSAFDAGIIPVVSSGNDGFNNGITSPACAPNALSVGAVYDSNLGGVAWSTCTDSSTAADQVTCFSNSGNNLDILAPGVMISVANTTLGGTSQAAPHVAGAISILRADDVVPDDTPAQSINRLLSTGPWITDAKSGIQTRRLDLKAAVATVFPEPELTSFTWSGTHGIANRWRFANIYGKNRDLYVTHRNNGQFYATQVNKDKTKQNWSWYGGHGIADRWTFANIFGTNRELYVTHRNNGQLYATQLNENGTLKNWSWSGGHGVANRWTFANIFGTNKELYVTHRNNGQLYATQLNDNGTLKNWSWSGGHGIADRWAFADIFGSKRDIYLTHRNNGQFYATQLNDNGTLKNWSWSGGHGIADRWFMADIFGEGRKVYVTHRNNGQFYATQLNDDGTVTNWSWSGGHGVADRAAFVDFFGTGQAVYVTHRNNGTFYITRLNKNGTVTNWTKHGHGIANRWGFADVFGDGKQSYTTHRNTGYIYVTTPVD